MLRRSLVILIALVCCAFIWWVGPLIAIGYYRPLQSVWIRGILVTLILCWVLWPVVALVLNFIFRHLRSPLPKRKKSKQRDRVTARFYDAMHTLRHVGLSEQKTKWQRFIYRFKKRYIDIKPWYLVIGQKGVGKTTLIHESGERFLYAENFGLNHTIDIGETQDCNWWLTDRSVYIDTSGDWIQFNGQSEESGQAKQQLFKLLKRYRRHPKLDGIILCLDASWLLKATITERKSVADTLRTRILEIAALFASDLPVYVLISQLDKLPGGNAFLFLSDAELLKQGMGFSSTKENDLKQDDIRYQEWIMHISQYILEVLHDTLSEQTRQQLLLFIEAMGALRTPLFSLLEQLFPQLPIGYAGRLQHIWFGSTAMLQMSDMAKSHISEDHYLKQTGEMYYPALSQAISERGLLPFGQSVPLKSKVNLVTRYLCVCLMTLAIFGILSTRYAWETDYIAYIAARFDETKRMIKEIPVANKSSDDLIYAYEQLGYMNFQLAENAEIMLNPYFEHKIINNAVEKTYHRHLFKRFWPSVENYIKQTLTSEVDASHNDIYNTLKVYLMLGKPDKRFAPDLIQWFMHRWGDFAPVGYNSTDKKILSFHLNQLFSVAQKEAPVSKLDPELIHRARIKAMEVPISVRVVRKIQEQPLPPQIENITLADAAGRNVSLMLRRKSHKTVTDIAVTGFYTRASYRDVFLANLESTAEKMINEESWVLLAESKNHSQVSTLTSSQKLADEARKHYLIEYADAWDSFINDVSARPVSGLEDAALLARQLSDPSSPLANLVRFVARETSVTGSGQQDMGSWVDTTLRKFEDKKRNILGEIAGERTRFRFTPEKAVEDRFERVRQLGFQLFQTTSSNSDPLARLFEEIYTQLSTLSTMLRGGQILSQQNVFSQLRMTAARQPAPVRQVMMDLISESETFVSTTHRQNLNQEVTSLASGLCQKTIVGRYPFNRSSKTEVGINDFIRLFSPTGAMQDFFKDNLADYIDVNSDKWQVKEGNEHIVSNKTVKSFENASLIREMFFINGSPFSFSLFLLPLSLSTTVAEVILDIDGQIVNYSHGSATPYKLEWPGPKKGSYVRVTFKMASGHLETINYEGPWALFRFYDASHVRRQKTDRREMTFHLPAIDGLFRYEIRSTMLDFPLWSQALTRFSCPGGKR